MGGSKKSTTYQIGAPQTGSNPHEIWLSEIARTLYNQTDPARTYIAADWEKLFNPAQGQQYDPSQLPAFSPLYNMARTGLEDQYSVAKENILSTLPRGGGMARQLGNLETGRAKDVGSLQSQISAPIISDLYNKAYNAGFVTAPTQAMGGLGAAGQLNNIRSLGQGQLDMEATKAALGMTAQSEAAARQGSSAKGLGLGSMLGKGLGAAMPGIGSAIGGLGGTLGKGAGGAASSGITSGLGGYTALANTANPMMW